MRFDSRDELAQYLVNCNLLPNVFSNSLHDKPELDVLYSNMDAVPCHKDLVNRLFKFCRLVL